MTPVLPQLLLLAIFPAGVIAAALKDMTSFTIPNWISAALVAAFIPVALLVHMPMGAIGLSFAVGAGALVVGFAMFALGWCGGGDAKLLAASAIWLGRLLTPDGDLPYGLAIAAGALAAFPSSALIGIVPRV